ncbi:hypothetical protein [Paenibacillus harenae]|uniref:hypothetical protein n=1 Tax=Paenibacillus harenae TaxID=306543 RepID=UPI00278CA236|nr:hypothetical protein [Paenibacillus harenae]MDQ0063291.1 hypothetical protein [Paenibacillus harenae]
MNSSKSKETKEVSLSRLYLLRALYLLVVVGLGIVQWPEVIAKAVDPEKSWELMDGVVACMLTSFSLLSVLGFRYPLQMLPLLLWELLWKLIWLIVVALPLWTAGQMDESTWETASSCLLVVIFPFIIPWRYVFANYVKKRSERWR